MTLFYQYSMRSLLAFAVIGSLISAANAQSVVRRSISLYNGYVHAFGWDGQTSKHLVRSRFVIPADYKANGRLRLRLMFTSRSDQACSGRVWPSRLEVYRNNRQAHVEQEPHVMSIVPQDGSELYSLGLKHSGGTERMRVKNLLIRPPQGSNLSGLAPGDFIDLSFWVSNHTINACFSLKLNALDVVYVADH